MKTIVRKMMMAAMFLTLATTASAQNYQSLYSIQNNRAMFDGREMRDVDIRTFQILGFGYAKDAYNVYLDGKVLRFVDPQTFRLQATTPQHDPHANGQGISAGRGHNHDELSYGTHPGFGNPGPEYRHPATAEYMVTHFDVYYGGQKVNGAYANSFKSLGEGYGKDAFNVYYLGQKLQGATASSFKLLTEGYSKDAFNAYFCGQKIKDASGNTFKVLDHGYTKDAFNVFYYGQKVDGAHASSFRTDNNGYAHDSFNYYYYGKKVKR